MLSRFLLLPKQRFFVPSSLQLFVPSPNRPSMLRVLPVSNFSSQPGPTKSPPSSRRAVLNNMSHRLREKEHDVTIGECNVLLRKLGDSDLQRDLIKKMTKSGLKPNNNSLVAQVRQLRLEGDEVERLALIDLLNKQGVDTSKSNSRSPEQTSKERTNLLRKLLDEKDTKSASWNVFNKMIKNSAADEHHFNVMMQTCETSTQRRELMEKMSHLNVQPNPFHTPQ